MTAKLKIKRALAELGIFIFNKEKKEVLGRTWQNWAKIASFFATLYAVLAGIFAIHLGIFIALTPTPGENVKPWNYGLYGYPNYPNAKIVLVSHPKMLTYKITRGVAEFSQINQHYINHLLPHASASGVDGKCLNDSSLYGFRNGVPCIFIHVQKVHNWTPEKFNSSLKNATTILVNCSVTSSHQNLSIASIMSGISLNINNTEKGRSFPFVGQNDYRIPVMAVQLNLTGIDSMPANRATVTCRVDLDAMNLGPYTPESLMRDYDIPADNTIRINFEQ